MYNSLIIILLWLVDIPVVGVEAVACASGSHVVASVCDMPCIHPISIKFQHPFLHGQYLDVPCGKCLWCREKRKNEWAFRLDAESKSAECVFFVTLTYSTENLPLHNGLVSLNKKDLQDFHKRLRKNLELFNIHFRYFAVGEYGDTRCRPHYHVLYFCDTYMSRDFFADVVGKHWNKAELFVTDKGVEIPRSRGAFYYTAKYCLKDFDEYDFVDGVQRPFMVCSNRPGIGSNYLTPQMVKYHRETCRLFGTLQDGVKVSLPRYYRNKIWNEDERKALFSKYLLEHGNIDQSLLEQYIDDFGYVDGIRNYNAYYNDKFLTAKRLHKSKKKL